MSIVNYFNKDNLIPSKYLKVINEPPQKIFLSVKNVPLFQVYLPIDTSEIFEIIFNDKKLWLKSSFYVTDKKISKLRAPIFGVPFNKALNLVIKEGLIKSRFYLSNSDELKNNAVIADLLVHSAFNKKEIKYELQFWQMLDKDNQVFYVHSILNFYTKTVEHLDGAIILFTDEQRNLLFEKGKKIKGYYYQKYFRLDANIAIDLAIEIIRKFFPIEELANEYFEINTIG